MSNTIAQGNKVNKNSDQETNAHTMMINTQVGAGKSEKIKYSIHENKCGIALGVSIAVAILIGALVWTGTLSPQPDEGERHEVFSEESCVIMHDSFACPSGSGKGCTYKGK